MKFKVRGIVTWTLGDDDVNNEMKSGWCWHGCNVSMCLSSLQSPPPLCCTFSVTCKKSDNMLLKINKIES